MHGILVVDKPPGVTSAQAVDRVKRALRVKRAGHGGTLDPLATGVLPVCLGAATKLAQYLLADDKAYEAEGLFGIETDTLDRTGRVLAERPVAVTREQLEAALAGRTGAQEQIPPMYSAIKQGGVRLYERARAGEEVERAPRKIRIDRLELVRFDPPRFALAIACSKGTYVRSLVADLGADLGCGAHLTELRRTRSGRFTLDQAVSLDRLEEISVRDRLIPMSQATGLPSVVVPAGVEGRIRTGVQLPVEALTSEDHPQFQLLDERGRLLAIVRAQGGRIIYDRVFHDAGDP